MKSISYCNISTRTPTKARAVAEFFIGSSAYIALTDGLNGLLLFYNNPDINKNIRLTTLILI